MRFRSIFARIIFLHVIVVLLASLFTPLALFWFLKSAANNLHNEAMREQAVLVANYLVLRSDGSWALDLPPSLHDFYSQAYGRYAYAILDERGRVLFSSLPDQGPLFAVDDGGGDISFLEARRGNAAISGVALSRYIQNHRLWVQVGEDLAHRDVLIDDMVAGFFGQVGWITFPILLLLLAIDIVIFRRALRPLLDASHQARNIGPARTDVRLPLEAMPTEIRPLVHAVNQALDRLEQGFRSQREFTADAAHELRTPLAVLRTRLDTLGDQQATKALRQDLEGMARIVGQLLDIAELDSLVIDPIERADLRSVSAEVIELLAPLALAQGKEIALDAPAGPVWIKGNPDMLFRAVRNLTENAINHTAPGTTVEIVVGPQGLVSVLDRGPGIEESERELLFRRFWRRDRRRSGGAGLGLSIVRRIAEAHGTSVSVQNRAGGGAEFNLQLTPVERAAPVGEPGVPAMRYRDEVLTASDGLGAVSLTATSQATHRNRK
ncbi:MAG: ATP-binding protein [Xanthobacteraceae bacterium]